MIKTIYQRALSVLSRKPLKLWGLSLLSGLFLTLTGVLLGVIPGLALAVSLLFSVSMTMVFLHGYLGEEVCTVQLFDCFKDWATIKRVLCGMGYMLLWVILWSLIPIVGPVFGVIRSYEYALTPYILVNEPEVPITEAYKVSKKRTEGFKAKMFWADLLWLLLVWAAVLILILLAKIPFIGFLFGIVAALLIICAGLFGKLFTGLINAAFYVEIQRQTGEGPQFDDSMNVLNIPEKKKSSVSEDFMFCPECGAKNIKGSRFCTSCGKKLFVDPAPETPVEETAPAEAPEESAQE